MARKKRPEEHENHERWLVSYADFITLLFAFFVVMYALSSVNEGKYRVLSDSLVSAFKNAPQSLEPIQIGEPVRSDNNERVLLEDPIPLDPIESDPSNAEDDGTGSDSMDSSENESMNKVATRLERSLGNLIEDELISVTRTGKGLEVEINSSILFVSGSALLQAEAVPILVDIASIVRPVPNAIRIEGYTDNIPIETEVFPSNWELSAGRAASVVHLFADEGVDPFRMAAVGYGEYRPIAMNDTPEGRERNRRVVMLLMSEAAEKLYDAEQAVKIETEVIRERDVDLDAPVSLIEMPLMTPEAPVPDNMPEGLDLRGRDQSANSQERNRLMNLTDQLDELDVPLEEDTP